MHSGLLIGMQRANKQLSFKLQSAEERASFAPNKETHLAPILGLEVAKALT